MRLLLLFYLSFSLFTYLCVRFPQEVSLLLNNFPGERDTTLNKMCRLLPRFFGFGGDFLGRDFEGLFRRDASVEQVAKTRNLFSKKEKNLEAEREKKTSVPVRGGENKHLLSIFSIFLYPHTHRIPHSYFAHNGYFFRRQGTHATQFFSSRARLLFASEVPSRVFARRVIFLR
jgi:hypothetical protein